MHNLCNQTPSILMIHTALNKITSSGPQSIDILPDKCPIQISSLGKYLIFPDLLQFDTLSNLILGCRLLGTCRGSIDNKCPISMVIFETQIFARFTFPLKVNLVEAVVMQCIDVPGKT